MKFLMKKADLAILRSRARLTSMTNLLTAKMKKREKKSQKRQLLEEKTLTTKMKRTARIRSLMKI